MYSIELCVSTAELSVSAVMRCTFGVRCSAVTVSYARTLVQCNETRRAVGLRRNACNVKALLLCIVDGHGKCKVECSVTTTDSCDQKTARVTEQDKQHTHTRHTHTHTQAAAYTHIHTGARAQTHKAHRHKHKAQAHTHTHTQGAQAQTQGTGAHTHKAYTHARARAHTHTHTHAEAPVCNATRRKYTALLREIRGTHDKWTKDNEIHVSCRKYMDCQPLWWRHVTPR